MATSGGTTLIISISTLKDIDKASILLFYFGAEADFDYKFFIGLGIFAYGLSYFIVHDIFIHQRFKWFRNTNNIKWPRYVIIISIKI